MILTCIELASVLQSEVEASIVQLRREVRAFLNHASSTSVMTAMRVPAHLVSSPATFVARQTISGILRDSVSSIKTFLATVFSTRGFIPEFNVHHDRWLVQYVTDMLFLQVGTVGGNGERPVFCIPITDGRWLVVQVDDNLTINGRQIIYIVFRNSHDDENVEPMKIEVFRRGCGVRTETAVIKQRLYESISSAIERAHIANRDR